VTGALLALARWRGADYHVVNSAATLFFCIAIFSGVASLLTPALAAGAYALVARNRADSGSEHDALNLIVVIFTLAVAFFLLSDLLARDAIYAFNLAFAALAVAVVARFRPRLNAPLVAGVAVAAWAAAMVRVAADGPWSPAATVFAGWALLLIGASALVVILLQRWPARPWAQVGGASLAAGVLALPWSPG
jgi:hypothetical protein